MTATLALDPPTQLDELRRERLAPDRLRSAEAARRPALDIVDEWGRQSFPASDPPANW